MKSLRAAALVKMWNPPLSRRERGKRMSKKITGSKEVCQGGKGEKGGKMLKKESDHKKGRRGELQSKQALSSVWPHNLSL